MASPENALREIGWRKIEAECYCALVEYGEMAASELATYITASQEKVYQPLRLLESRGYVLIQNENPQRYRAQNPRFVIDEERDAFQSDTDEILRDLEEAWEMAEEGIPQASEYAWVLSGKGGMRTEQARLIDEAESSIIGFDTRFQLSTPPTLDSIEEQAKDGVDIRLIGLENARERLSRLNDSGIDVKIHDGDGLREPSFYISDGEEVLLNVSGGKATVVFTDQNFAEVMEMRFEELSNEVKSITNEE